MNPEVVFPNIGIEIERLPRVAFTVFGVELYIYGVMIATGIAAGVYYAVREAKRTGQDPEFYINFTLYALIAAIIGARLYYVIFSWDVYKEDLIKIFAVREGGLAVYGGVIASVICAVVYTKKHKTSFWLFADTAAPALILGQAIGRWGNFFNREAFGGYTEGLFAMRYIASQADFVPRQIAERVITVNGTEYIQVHPTFLYESVWCVFIFIIMNIYKMRKKNDGEVFLIYLAGYGAGRFLIEGLRADQLLIWGTGLAVSQIFSALLALVGVVLFMRSRMRTA